ncbi:MULTISPECIES: hypothetical protein [Halomonas]|uniref:hypothetical protein n=1 Tax=Halomonas TaxID=2745 RepID=UPI001C937BC0|nr:MULTISPECIES: hypothetical protein [Halomonas]MBY6208733.1 hypothetical protein [Halomonas sp. DP3Y7-2]MBY6227203.1 hypothetical protein [Halomonas sp. DP3Y7-1]MCA0915047.1 hypothetical protein [Halomonas denitrificans]
MAELIRDVRASAVDSYAPEEGDTTKSLGFTAYERTRSIICSTAGTPGFEWLSVLTPDRRFTFRIGDTPVRFWKGIAERLPGSKLLRSEEALRQTELNFHDEPINSLIWYIIVETGPDKLVERAYLIGFTEHGIQHINWEIPIKGKITTLASAEDSKTEGVEMVSAAARLRKKDKGKDHGNRDASQE